MVKENDVDAHIYHMVDMESDALPKPAQNVSTFNLQKKVSWYSAIEVLSCIVHKSVGPFLLTCN